MRSPAPILALLAVLGAVATWMLLANDNVAPPPAPVDGRPPPPTRGERAPPQSERSGSVPEQAAAAPIAPAPATTAGGSPRQDAAPSNVSLRVRTLTTHDFVPAFHWRFSGGDAVAIGEGQDGRADLHLDEGRAGQLLIEAEGCTPDMRHIVVPRATAAAMTIDVFLRPAVTAADIQLLVHDLALQPVAHVRVDAFALSTDRPSPEDQTSTAWVLGTPLWSRRTHAADGRYVLPELPPGAYGIRVVATTEDGKLLPLRAFTRTFVLTGSNGFVEDVPLETGSLPVLEVVDAAGNPLDPAQAGRTTLQLRLTGGPNVTRRWSVDLAPGAGSTTAIDELPGVGATQPAEALPPGSYEVEITVAGKPPVHRLITLRPGETQVERIVVP